MAERGYKIRINVKQVNGKEDRLYCYVAFPDDAREMFTKPYVSVKRMQDRLAFVPWDNKTGRGTVAVGANSIQFGLQSDCEKMQDFCGEYNLVNMTDSGVVFVKLADRRPFKRELDTTPHANDSCPTVMPVVGQAQSLSDALRGAIESKEAELRKANEELDTALALAEDARRNRDRVEKELLAYKAAFDVAKGGE